MRKITTQNWNYIYTLSGHSDGVTALDISFDGRYLASVSWDQTLRIWSLETGALIASSVAHTQGLLAVTFTGFVHGNYYLATGGFEQNIRLWRFTPGNTEERMLTSTHTLTGHVGSIRVLAIAPDGQTLISGSYDQTVKQWNLNRKVMLCSSYDPLGAINAITVSKDGNMIASAGEDGSINCWQLGSGKILSFLSGNVYSVKSLVFSPDGKSL
ncbi:MAG: WD40 repeat domain-containing protein, partial [Moorea sp. SIO2B7]|nr:WD40 repeat domain-containing protein [Moorena sp. SIO2B7]